MEARIVVDGGSSSADHCVCGAVHRVPLDVVVIGEDALDQLVVYVKRRQWSSPLVVMDANTEEVAGGRVFDELSRANISVVTLCFPERKGLLANEASVSRLREALNDTGADSIVAVGSGVITDTTRYVATREGREFVSVPTAASMDGYASSVAVMEFGGMKTSYPSVPPVAIFAEPHTVAAAPLDMTRSGLGDLFGKASARVDWVASHCLYGEHFCAAVEQRVTAPLIDAATQVEEILQGSPEGVSGLLRGLVESGIAIAMMGSSRPASGCEHHASHLWDLLAANGRRTHCPHGLQVGYATHFAMALQQYAFGGSVGELVSPRPIGPDGEDARSWYAGHGAQVDALMDEKRRFVIANASSWPATSSQWEAVRNKVTETMSVFPLVAGALSLAGIPAGQGFLGFDAATLRATFRWANRIRSRYTVLDFLEGQEKLDQAIDATVPRDS
jgi:glycerol-1-phosphate dehydrogenase [NAD(P)+]